MWHVNKLDNERFIVSGEKNPTCVASPKSTKQANAGALGFTVSCFVTCHSGKKLRFL